MSTKSEVFYAQLGMPQGTAQNKLRKRILFSLLARLGENFCYRCGREIPNEETLSIEHKQAWLHKDSNLFWNLDNIAFSHLTCNIRAAATGPHPDRRKYFPPEGEAYCRICKKNKPLSEFYKANNTRGVQAECKSCHASWKQRIQGSSNR